MIANIALIEADFRREYRLDLKAALGPWGMSWRAFRGALSGLSGQSAWAFLGSKTGKQPQGIELGVAHLASIAEPAEA